MAGRRQDAVTSIGANAAFTLYTSAEDYARFIVEILREDRDGKHSISAATRRQMLTPVAHRDEQNADWGLGWGLSQFQGRRRVYHGGSNGTGFRCLCEFFPETGGRLGDHDQRRRRQSAVRRIG